MNKRVLIFVMVAAILIVAVLLYYISSQNGSALSKYDDVLVNQSVVAQLNVPNDLLASVGVGSAVNSFQRANSITGLAMNGKPEILYVGADYCPYCAALRWPMIIALSRFGTFSNLHYMTSSASDIFPSTPTFTFYNSSYQSDYIAFVPVEVSGNRIVNGSYPTLQRLNASQSNIMNTFNLGGGLPFADFANASILLGTTFNPSVMGNGDWAQILGQIYQTNSTVSQAMLGSANYITAQICKIDNNQPQSVCGQSYIQRIETLV